MNSEAVDESRCRERSRFEVSENGRAAVRNQRGNDGGGDGEDDNDDDYGGVGGGTG